MKQELKKYPKMQLVTHRLRQRRPDHRDPGDPGPAAALPEPQGHHLADHGGHPGRGPGASTRPSTSGKVALTGLGTPNSMKKYVADGTIQSFELWNPADLGYLAGYAAVNYASKKITSASGQSFTAGKLGKFTVGADKHHPAGPAVRVHQGQHQPVQLLTRRRADRRAAIPAGGPPASQNAPGNGPWPPAWPWTTMPQEVQWSASASSPGSGPDRLDEYRERHAAGLAGDDCARCGRGLGQLLALPGRRRAARRLPGDRRLRGGASSGWRRPTSTSAGRRRWRRSSPTR